MTGASQRRFLFSSMFVSGVWEPCSLELISLRISISWILDLSLVSDYQCDNCSALELTPPDQFRGFCLPPPPLVSAVSRQTALLISS